MKREKRYSRQLVLQVGELVLRNRKNRGFIKFIAESMRVSPQTIGNWKRLAAKESKPEIGRPKASAHSRSTARKIVAEEMRKQGYPGWRPISNALPNLPVRLVQEAVAKIKLERRKSSAKRIKQQRISVEVTAREAIWTIDGTQTKDERNEKSFNQVIKDRGSLAYRAILSGGPARATDIKELLESAPTLPLVIASDNDKIYCGSETSEWLAANKIVHLRSLPRTPQHNGAMEVAMRELKQAAGYASPQKLVEIAKQINEFRPRAARSYKTSTVLDAEMPAAYSKVSREEFYEKCTMRLSQISKSTMEWREKRMAERETIYATLEEYGLIKRTGAKALCSA